MKFQGRGTVYAAVRDASGNYGVEFDFGCLDELKLGLKADTFTHIEKCSGADGIDYRGTKSLDGTVTIGFTEWKRKSLAQAMQASFRSLSGEKTGSITGEIINATEVLPGDKYRPKRGGATSVVITDSTPTTPAVVPSGQYNVAAGKITFDTDFDDSALIYPLKVAYTYAEPNYLSLFQAGQVELSLRFEGLNKANSLSAVTVELYRLLFDPASDIDFMSDEIAPFNLTGSLLVDDTKSASGNLGQYGRVMDATFA